MGHKSSSAIALLKVVKAQLGGMAGMQSGVHRMVDQRP